MVSVNSMWCGILIHSKLTETFSGAKGKLSGAKGVGKVFIMIIIYYLIILTVAGPAQCNVCNARDEATCTFFQRNQTCATDRESLGSTHCGSVAITYLDYSGVITNGTIKGCFNCTGNKILFEIQN